MTAALEVPPLWVGTVKGLFRFDRPDQEDCSPTPMLAGWECGAVLPERDSVLVGTAHYAYGPTIRRSTDGGETWSIHALKETAADVSHPLNRIWQLVRDSHDSSRIWCGIDEAALLHSTDGGETWSELTTLTQHPSRPHWNPGGGGLCLHTIVQHPTDPQRMVVGISAVGVFGTQDGGHTWHAQNTGLPAIAETGAPVEEAMHCIHKIASDPTDADRLYMQYHAHGGSSGIFRSDDFGQSWTAIDENLPHKFGFPLVVLKDGTVLVVPLHSDEQRVPAEGQFRVRRSCDGGKTWETNAGGLPEPSFVGVLRDAMAVSDDGRVALGTTTGDVCLSDDGGVTWRPLATRLPRVLCVRFGR